MKRWTLLLALPLVVAACRTIVGIDDLEQQPGGQNNRDGGPGAPSDAEAGGSTGPSCAGEADCVRCCKEQYKALGPKFENDPGKRCMCDPLKEGTCGSANGDCNVECAAGSLAGDAGSGGNKCRQCVDRNLMSASSTAIGQCADAECAGDKACVDGIACMRSCRRP